MTPDQTTTTVLLAGATGLVGRECLDLLLKEKTISHVTAIVRRPVPDRTDGERLSIRTVDFERLENHTGLFAVNQIICTLGTTIRQAGSQQAFRRVDFDYPMNIARLGLAHGASHFLLVSAMGASTSSRVFYSRVKGELEEAVASLGYYHLTIVRPSLLLGERSEFRFGEEVAKRFAFLLPRSYRPISARIVAAALVWAARSDQRGTHIIENCSLHRPAEE